MNRPKQNLLLKLLCPEKQQQVPYLAVGVKSAEKSEYFILQVNISYKGTSFISAYNCSEKYKRLVLFSRC